MKLSDLALRPHGMKAYFTKAGGYVMELQEMHGHC